MSSPPNVSGPNDTLSHRVSPSPPDPHPSVRKAPPFPLAISSSSLSPRSLTPNSKIASSSSSPNARNSLESSRSDMTSHSDVTSLHCSEFPAPPSSLPPIPASPRTPRSLYFSTTPTTPRSRSPQSEFALPMQEPPRSSGRGLLGSPRSLKAFLTGSHSSGSQSKIISQLDQPPQRTEPKTSRSFEDLKLGYERSRLSVPARFSQYAVYKDAIKAADVSRSETPTTAGILTSRDWLSSSGRSSPLQPPRPAYVRDTAPARSHSPLRTGSSFATQQDEVKLVSDPDRTEYPHSPQSMSAQAPLSPQSISPQPPRSPLPVPPSKRESPRESARYSHIARKAGVTDMGIDISEEQLLSTDFITEMLKQPGTSSPRAQFLRLPDSPRSPTLSVDDPHGLGRHIRGSEMRLAPESNLALASPGFAPMSVSLSERSVALEDILSPRTPDAGSALPQEEDSPDTESPKTRSRSPIPSSIFAKGGDKIYLDQPSPLPAPVSPNSQLLAVPENVTWGHGSPHPLVPSTPMSMDSFIDTTSPQKLRGFAQAQAKHLSMVRKASTSQSIAARLPIGPSSGSSPTGTGGPTASSSRIGSPRVRQHRYPRPGATKPAAQTNQSPVTVVLQRAASAAGSSSSRSKEHERNPTAEEKNEPSAQAQPAVHDVESSNDLAGSSNASPAVTQHDTLIVSPIVDSRRTSSHEGSQTNKLSSESRSHSEYSYESNNVSSDSVHDDEGLAFDMVGEVQTASRVWDATAPVIAKIGDTTRPTVVGTATAVVVRSMSVDRHAGKERVQDRLHLDASSPTSGFEPDVVAPASPRHPPSIESPPSHHHRDMSESAKSVYFSGDAQDEEERAYLPYDEVTGYGPTFWDINRNTSLRAQASDNAPKPRPSNATGSVKSVVSYITAKSKASTVSSKVTRVSHKSTLSAVSSRLAWFKKKPLPPVPTTSSSSPTNVLVNAYVDRNEPQLPVHKAQTGNASPILEPGQYQRSKISLIGQGEPQGWSDIISEKWSPEHREDDDGAGVTFYSSIGKFDMLTADSVKFAKRNSSRRRDDSKSNETSVHGVRGMSGFSDSDPSRFLRPFRPMIGTKSRRWILFVAMGVVMLAIILGASLGLTLGRMRPDDTPTSCGGNRTGFYCDLDATCTCPSSLSGTCAAPLAGALNALVPVTSQLFSTDVTSQGIALVIWESQGTPTTSNCAFQANIVDVGSVLDATVSPNRTEWAQAALLWTLFKSGDIDAVRSMQLALAQLPFNSLHSKDGIVADPTGQFSVSSSGYIFNFANQTATLPPLTFKVDGSPSSDQLSRVNSVSQGALDRMYSFASASSTQRQVALSTYWRSVLSLSSSDLPTFLLAFKSAPILLPFDATSSPRGGQAISDLLTNAVNRTLSFPPAIGCYPDLSAAQLQQISTVETTAFGLTPLNSTASSFDSSCFANRPVYGVLDILRTRLPFSDSRIGVAKQSAVLTSDAASRAILHVGELLSALPASTNINLTSFDVDSREFGTVSHLNHIALEWLQSFPTTALATEAAKFVLSSPSAPPPSSSSLFNATSLPIVEVAMFGDIFLSDFSSYSSSFSTPSGSLFFGSSQAQAFRRWALQQSLSSATIVWAQSTFSPQAVHESPLPNSLFEEIWSAAGSLTSGPTNSSSVQEVVNALQSDGFFGL